MEYLRKQHLRNKKADQKTTYPSKVVSICSNSSDPSIDSQKEGEGEEATSMDEVGNRVSEHPDKMDMLEPSNDTGKEVAKSPGKINTMKSSNKPGGIMPNRPRRINTMQSSKETKKNEVKNPKSFSTILASVKKRGRIKTLASLNKGNVGSIQALPRQLFESNIDPSNFNGSQAYKTGRRPRRIITLQSSSSESDSFEYRHDQATKRPRRINTLQSFSTVSDSLKHRTNQATKRPRRISTLQASSSDPDSLKYRHDRATKRPRRIITLQSVSSDFDSTKKRPDQSTEGAHSLSMKVSSLTDSEGFEKIVCKRNYANGSSITSERTRSSKSRPNGHAERFEEDIITIESSDEEEETLSIHRQPDDGRISNRGEIFNPQSKPKISINERLQMRKNPDSEPNLPPPSSRGHTNQGIFPDNSGEDKESRKEGEMLSKEAWKKHDLVKWNTESETKKSEFYTSCLPKESNYTSSLRSVKKPNFFGSLVDSYEVDEALSHPSNVLSWKHEPKVQRSSKSDRDENQDSVNLEDDKSKSHSSDSVVEILQDSDVSGDESEDKDSDYDVESVGSSDSG